MELIDNSVDLINCEEILERHKKLKYELDDLINDLADVDGSFQDIAYENIDHFKQSYEYDEFQGLEALIKENDTSRWNKGSVLIRDSAFEQYAKTLVEDVFSYETNVWPFDHINWKSASEALKQDYKSIDFGGVSYWIRA